MQFELVMFELAPVDGDGTFLMRISFFRREWAQRIEQSAASGVQLAGLGIPGLCDPEVYR